MTQESMTKIDTSQNQSATTSKPLEKLPRNKDNDYTHDIAAARRAMVEKNSGHSLNHTGQYSIPPDALPGNIEGFSGIVQVPMGFAGPVLIHGEQAQGEFYVPMATTEGTLVASFSRGMSLTRKAGGIITTVIDDAMQRAPVFVFKDARAARDFGQWVSANFEHIKAAAETTTSSGKLRDIEQYAASKMRWLRFNMTTGDAAGQNMVSKATHAACQWILAQQPAGLEHFTLAANFDTDKKHSAVNNLHSRGKRVVAEITIPAELFQPIMHCDAKDLMYQRGLSNLGGFISGSVSNGAHFANGIAAIFLACGQDIANIAESGVGFVYTELKDNGDYYMSVTIPSLIVATYGGGTGLPTQRECLQAMDCYGAGKVYKLAEIIAATVLCGELSLSSAIVSNEWVSSHDAYGRNRK